MKILLRNLTKRFPDRNKKTRGEITAVNDLTLEIPDGKLVGLLGPSGCGKTTTLRIIGGFETPDAGSVIFDGKDITSLPPNERNLNTVFQKYALFPHMSIAENIAFGLRIKKKSKEYINDKIVVETYDSKLNLVSSKNVAAELPIFGGIYIGENYNYAVFGHRKHNMGKNTPYRSSIYCRCFHYSIWYKFIKGNK